MSMKKMFENATPHFNFEINKTGLDLGLVSTVIGFLISIGLNYPWQHKILDMKNSSVRKLVAFHSFIVSVWSQCDGINIILR